MRSRRAARVHWALAEPACGGAIQIDGVPRFPPRKTRSEPSTTSVRGKRANALCQRQPDATLASSPLVCLPTLTLGFLAGECPQRCGLVLQIDITRVANTPGKQRHQKLRRSRPRRSLPPHPLRGAAHPPLPAVPPAASRLAPPPTLPTPRLVPAVSSLVHLSKWALEIAPRSPTSREAALSRSHVYQRAKRAKGISLAPGIVPKGPSRCARRPQRRTVTNPPKAATTRCRPADYVPQFNGALSAFATQCRQRRACCQRGEARRCSAGWPWPFCWCGGPVETQMPVAGAHPSEPSQSPAIRTLARPAPLTSLVHARAVQRPLLPAASPGQCVGPL